MFKLAAIEQMIYSATGFAFFWGRPRGRRGRLGLSLSALESSDSLSAGASVGSTACSVAALALQLLLAVLQPELLLQLSLVSLLH